MKCGVHIFTGSFGSSGSPVHLRTRNNLYCVKCGVHVFSGSFGSSGSAVDQRTKYFPLPSQTSQLVWSMVKSGPAFCSLASLEPPKDIGVYVPLVQFCKKTSKQGKPT